MKNILLIEPNTALAHLYTDILTYKGFRVVRAVGAQVAIEAADACTPDIVILELQLPRHSGIEFLHEFRSYPEWWSVPIIVNTNFSPTHLAALQEPLKNELGVREILYKPQTSLQALVQAVRGQLQST